jgi:hypothetical protein
VYAPYLRAPATRSCAECSGLNARG